MNAAQSVVANGRFRSTALGATVLQDAKLAGEMWERIRAFVPTLDRQFACGVDTQLRIYRYLPGQQFKPHKDGAVSNGLRQKSKLSYLIYLNDDCDGGSTQFRDYCNLNGSRKRIELSELPVAGSGLVFRQERWHEGTPVISGAKYVLRSDLFYASR